jgi:hypothetical protein
MLLFSINRSRGYENPSLDIIVTERCSIGGCPLEEACEHCYLIQSAISVAISYIISMYCEDYAGYFTVILSFLAFRFCSAYFIYLVSCIPCVDVFVADDFFVWAPILRTRLALHLGAHLADVPCVALGRPTCGCDLRLCCGRALGRPTCGLVLHCIGAPNLWTCLALRWGAHLADVPCVALGRPTLVRLY